MSNDLISRRAVIKAINELMKSPYANTPHNGVTEKEAIEWLVKERQIAKKPVKDKYNHGCCPECGRIIYQTEYGGRYLPHCENCGQAIDWSD